MTEDPNMEFSDREAENFGPNGYDRTPQNEPLDVGDDIASIPPRGWLVGNTFCRRFISGLVAQGGGAKTTVRLLQALSLARQYQGTRKSHPPTRRALPARSRHGAIGGHGA